VLGEHACAGARADRAPLRLVQPQVALDVVGVGRENVRLTSSISISAMR
jgi:hypothetical protein